MVSKLDIPATTVLTREVDYLYYCRIDNILVNLTVRIDQSGQTIHVNGDTLDAPYIGETLGLTMCVNGRNYLLGYFKNEGYRVWFRTVYPVLVF